MPHVLSPRRAPFWGSPGGENIDVLFLVRLPAPAVRRAGEWRSDRCVPGQIVMPRFAREHSGQYKLTTVTAVNL